MHVFPRAVAIVCFVATAGPFSGALAQYLNPAGEIVVPESSVRQSQPSLAGAESKVRAFTNIAVFVPETQVEPPSATSTAAATYFIETPASIACAYNLVPQASGCNPNSIRINPSGGSKAIAIVDAYDAPNIKADLKAFDERFNVPTANFSVVFASGFQPPTDEGWEMEISLDVEWAHAMAPNAEIILVEAASSSLEDLFLAVDKAAELVAAKGGGEISLSWGGAEFPAEAGYDARYFAKSGIVYFAASGDDPGMGYPACSPRVVAVGGTTIIRDRSGAFIGETPWSSAGAGPCAFEGRPNFQSAISDIVGSARGIVDLAAVANPRTGVWVYDSGNSNASTNKGWIVVGGTSAATPIVAAITNLAGRFAPSTADELDSVYSNNKDFNEMLNGTCGANGVYASAPDDWNYCTGVGSPKGKNGL